MPDEIRDDLAHNRFVFEEDGSVAWVRYKREPGRITFIHTEVPRELGGRGIAGRLARHVLDYARRQGLRIIVLCPFIRAWMKKHPEYDDLVAEPGSR
jgi:uncharacterized protein